jgi:hypothetical protein
MMEKSYEELQAENEYLRKKLQEEHDYQEYLKTHRIRGQLAGAIVMDAESFIEHKARENMEKVRIELTKLAHNPALSDDARNTIEAGAYMIEVCKFWREQANVWRKKAEK